MKWITITNRSFCLRLPAVQHERAPKMTSVSSSTHGLSYAANLYAARHQDGLFPFQMPFATPAVAFPLDSYYMPSPYYPHLAESLNLKFNQSVSVFKPQLIQPTNYDLEIGKLINDSAISRMPTEGTKTREKDNEVSSSEEIPTMLPNDFVRLKSNQSLHDTATKLLFLSIRWAKSIPSFHQLSLVDQKRLLNESWAELFVIAASQWGLSIDEELLETSSYLKRLQTFIRHFAVLKIDHFEAACLKALVLFRCNLSEDQTPSQQILFLQNQTLCLLIEKCGGLRFGHLLLILPQIRIVGNVQSLQVRSHVDSSFDCQYFSRF